MPDATAMKRLYDDIVSTVLKHQKSNDDLSVLVFGQTALAEHSLCEPSAKADYYLAELKKPINGPYSAGTPDPRLHSDVNLARGMCADENTKVAYYAEGEDGRRVTISVPSPAWLAAHLSSIALSTDHESLADIAFRASKLDDFGPVMSQMAIDNDGILFEQACSTLLTEATSYYRSELDNVGSALRSIVIEMNTYPKATRRLLEHCRETIDENPLFNDDLWEVEDRDLQWPEQWSSWDPRFADGSDAERDIARAHKEAPRRRSSEASATLSI